MLNHVDGGPTEFSHLRYTAATCDPNDFTAAVRGLCAFTLPSAAC